MGARTERDRPRLRGRRRREGLRRSAQPSSARRIGARLRHQPAEQRLHRSTTRTRRARAAVESRSASSERFWTDEHVDRSHSGSRQPRVQVRLRHRHRAGRYPARAQRRHRPADFGEEERAGMAARVAAEGLPHVAHDEGADVGQRQVRADRLSEHHLLLRAQAEADAAEPRRGRSRDPADVRQARHSARRAEAAVGCRRGRRVRQRVGGDDVQGQAGVARDHLLFVLRRGAGASGARAEVSRHGRAVFRQLLRDAQLGGVQRRLVRLHPEGRALPDGAVDLLPDQRAEHRPVRADADRRRRRRVGQLPRRLHGADARREPAARGGRRARRARQRHDQVLDGPELVPGRQGRARAASTTSSPSAASAWA